MIIQTFKMQFQCVMWITRHSSIWICQKQHSLQSSNPITKTWVMTLSSSVAMYSVMRDKPDARKVPMERGWVVLYLYATCKFSNLLTLEQWAFEYGLPFFYTHCSTPYETHLKNQRVDFVKKEKNAVKSQKVGFFQKSQKLLTENLHERPPIQNIQ